MDSWKLVKILLGGIKLYFDYAFVNILKLSFIEK